MPFFSAQSGISPRMLLRRREQRGDKTMRRKGKVVVLLCEQGAGGDVHKLHNLHSYGNIG